MTIFESTLSSRYFKRGLETHLLEKLARALPWVLGLYLVMKAVQLTLEGHLGLLFGSGLMSILFWAEITLGVLLPILLFAIRSIRNSPGGLFAGGTLVLIGMILNRFNVSWFGVEHYDSITYVPTFMGKVTYFPTIPEILVSVGIFSAGILAFGLAAKYLPVFESEHHESQAPSGD